MSIPEYYQPAPRGITLYTAGTPNGFKISAALELLHLPYKLVNVQLLKSVHRQPWFSEHISPSTLIPALIDIDETGEQVRLFESAAILMYLAEKYDKDHKISFERGTPQYYESLEWIHFQTSGVEMLQVPATFQTLFMKKRKNPQFIAQYAKASQLKYEVLETRLAKNGTGFFVGDHLSIVDIAVMSWAMVSPALNIPLEEKFPLLNAWLHKMADEPTIAKAWSIPTPFPQFKKSFALSHI